MQEILGISAWLAGQLILLVAWLMLKHNEWGLEAVRDVSLYLEIVGFLLVIFGGFAFIVA